MHYGAEFSPDNSKLYTVSYNTAGNSVIEQYDLSLSSPAAIRASRDTIVFGATGLTTAMRLGPDGKIYLNSFIGDSSEYVDVINYPNLSGTACGYQHCAIALLNHTSGVLGMPSLFVSKPLNFVGTRRMDTTVCSGARIFPYGPAPGYLWFDGTTQSYDSVNVAGTYWVLEETGCDAISDSIHVALKPSPQPITGRNSVCRGNSIALSESVTGGVWSTGSPGIASVDGMGLVTGLAMGDAIISYSLADSCAATKEITVLPPCIDETEEPATSDFDVVLFPNPTRELCTISMSGPLPSDVSVYIYDVAGRLVHTYALSAAQTTVSVSDMAAGIYQCSIIATGQIIAHRKLVVVR